MNSSPSADDQEEQQEKSIFKKMFSLINFKKPGTKEDLENEIQELLEEGEEHGLISSLEEKMINSILEFRETNASEIMTPAAEVVSHDIEKPLTDLVEVVIESGFTRIPVYRENPDQIIGAVHSKDLLRLCARPEDGPLNWDDCLRPVFFIDEAKPIVDLLRDFQKRKLHMAIVTDEFGAVRGLITLEDILEEIVGEIDDEYDDDETVVEIIDDNSVQVHGWTDREEIEEHFDRELPEGPYESIGGLVVHLLGRLAEPGDEVECNGLRFEVKSASDRYIKSILVTRLNGAKGGERK